MKLENINSNGVLYKNKIQNNYKTMFTSKINEIESLIKNDNLEEKQKILEIQKKNAYYKLEKLSKELENIENYAVEDNEEMESVYLNEDEILKNKINDIRQKNINIQEQIKMMRDYYSNFLLKYKNKQTEEKKELNEEVDKIREHIMKIKCYTKMTDEEEIILEKEHEIKKLDKEMEKILKKIEEARTQKYISSLRLKELKNIINKNAKKKEKKKKEIPKKRNNYSENKKNDFGDLLTNIKLAQNTNSFSNKNNSNNRISQENNESTINIINRKLPFSISALDNLINGENDEFDLSKTKKPLPKITENKSINVNKKKKFDLNLPKKISINKINNSFENKINSDDNKINNNNINIINNNNYKKQSNKYRNFNIIKTNNNEQKEKANNIIPENKSENKNIKDNSPLGWLEDDTKFEKLKNDNINNNELKSNGLSRKNENSNQEDIKINNSEEINKNDNVFNNRNLEIKGIQGTFNRRKPFSSIKF